MPEEITAQEWKARQHRMNIFTSKSLKGIGDIKEDGDPGPATEKRIRQCKYWLGWEEHTATWSEKFHKALIDPNNPHITSRGTVTRGRRRRRAQRRHHIKSYLRRGVASYDGVRVAKTAIPVLQWCRGNGWPGHVVSGYRDPAYSESLCYAMCGAPSCPGKCAGRASNHAGNGPERFALDVSDYAKFKQVVAKCPVNPKIKNDLPVDPVHFSPNGK